MKKTLLILSLILVVGLTATIAYAQNQTIVKTEPKVAPRTNVNYEEWDNWYQERVEWRKSQIDQAIKNKEITGEQAKAWSDHFDYMEEFHREYGPMPGGGCHGDGYGWNNRNRFSGRMMRGNRWSR